MTDKIKLLEEIIESCTDKYGDNRNEIAKALFLLNEIKAAINYTRCCESVKDKYTHTFEVDLNSVKRQEQYNKQIEQIHNAPCKTYIFDGEKYIELKP
tara:strand:+ start:48 stop:341 length:294 start_codon:yes stop_codon:yes gene_type:complete